MSGRHFLTAAVLMAACWAAFDAEPAQAAPPGQPADWNRFYYYPYVFYPHNFQRAPTTYDSLYYRYPPERRIPVYNENWHNFYPSEREWYRGHHFKLDVF